MSIKETASDLEQAAGRPTRAGPASIRPYSAEDVVRLRGTVQEEHTLARLGAERLWDAAARARLRAGARRAHRQPGRAEVKAGLEAIYLSGWQVAADANSAGQTYPDQSLYPVDSVPRSSAGSTTRCCAPTRSSTARATATRRTGWPRSWPTPRPASAAR